MRRSQTLKTVEHDNCWYCLAWPSQIITRSADYDNDEIASTGVEQSEQLLKDHSWKRTITKTQTQHAKIKHQQRKLQNARQTQQTRSKHNSHKHNKHETQPHRMQTGTHHTHGCEFVRIPAICEHFTLITKLGYCSRSPTPVEKTNEICLACSPSDWVCNCSWKRFRPINHLAGTS